MADELDFAGAYREAHFLMLPLHWITLRMVVQCRSELLLSWSWFDNDHATSVLGAAKTVSHPSIVPFVAGRLAGDLGYIMQRRSCPFGAGGTLECALRETQCLFGDLFRTVHRRPKRTDPNTVVIEEVPRPLLIDVEWPDRHRMEAGEFFAFDVTLIGRTIGTWSLVLAAVVELGERGVGRGARHGLGRFQLEEVRPLARYRQPAWTLPSLYDPALQQLTGEPPEIGESTLLERSEQFDSPRLVVRLLRPTRVRDGGDEFDFAALWDALMSRLQQLCALYGNGPLEAPFAELKEQARRVRLVRRQIRWEKQERVSAPKAPSERRRLVDVSGYLGELEFEGDFTLLLPYLLAGEWLGVGRHCDLGNGRYRVELPSSASIFLPS